MFSPSDQRGTLLLIEDNPHIAESVADYLGQRGYAVDCAFNAVGGLHLAATNGYDAIMLDVRLPGMDGVAVCVQLRTQERIATPLLMLTACGELSDRLAGLDAGADDYLVKPFDLRELEARLRALIRRHRHQVSPATLVVGDLVFDTETLQITRAGIALTPTPMGMKILHILMRESPRVVSRRNIEREVWGEDCPQSDTLRSHVHCPRRVIDRPFPQALLQTVSAGGYRMVCADQGH